MTSNTTCAISAELSTSAVFVAGIIARLIINVVGAVANLSFVLLLISMSALDASVKCLLVNLSGALAAYALNTLVICVYMLRLVVSGDVCALQVRGCEGSLSPAL